MREEARLAVGFVAGMDYDAFIQSEVTKRAVSMTLANIGESVRRVSDEARERCPGIPWAAIRKTRNVIAHDYEEVDFAEIWHTSTIDLPVLIDAIEQLERELGEPLYGEGEQERNQQMILRAIEDADRQGGGGWTRRGNENA
jgi:uncharacterized protein with HEPN domain